MDFNKVIRAGFFPPNQIAYSEIWSAKEKGGFGGKKTVANLVAIAQLVGQVFDSKRLIKLRIPTIVEIFNPRPLKAAGQSDRRRGHHAEPKRAGRTEEPRKAGRRRTPCPPQARGQDARTP